MFSYILNNRQIYFLDGRRSLHEDAFRVSQDRPRESLHTLWVEDVVLAYLWPWAKAYALILVNGFPWLQTMPEGHG